ncbi:MAG: hypothetical protein HY055_15500, partial [Magnetospirillum sp.]|nr:hypothetical protein [Magnetospirillum sp.]
IPARLRAMVPGVSVTSVAFVEVDEARTSPAAYAASFGAKKLPFDLIWFTARAERADPCAQMEKHMKKKEAK